MSVQGTWSGEEDVFHQCIELVYDNSKGALNDNLLLPNLDTPIHKIELLEIRFDSVAPLSLLSVGFKNKNGPLRDMGHSSTRTIVSIFNVSPFDNTVHGNQYQSPPILYRNMARSKKDSCPEFRMNVFAYPSMTPLSPSLAFIRLRISRFKLAGTSIDMKHEPQILMA